MQKSMGDVDHVSSKKYKRSSLAKFTIDQFAVILMPLKINASRNIQMNLKMLFDYAVLYKNTNGNNVYK